MAGEAGATPLHPAVAADLRAQYRARPAGKDRPGSRVASFLVARVPLSDASGPAAVAVGGEESASASASSTSAGSAAPGGDGTALLRRLHGGAGYGAGAEKPLAVVAGAAIHAATGLWLDQLPYTPENVWKALQEQRRSRMG